MIRTLQLNILLLGYLLLASMQMDAQGWEKKYSPDATMAINTVYPTYDGNYLATGWNIGSNPTFQRIMKIDGNGNVVWKSDIDSIYNPTVANITQDRGLIIIGYGPSDVAGYTPTHSNIVRVDSNGHKIWLRTLHPERHLVSGNGGADIDTTDNGGFICTYTAVDTAAGSSSHIYVSRLDAIGNILWERSYFPADTLPVSYAIRNSKDGGFVLTAGGNATSALFVFKIDGGGNLLWQYRPGQPNYITTSISRDGNILLVSAPFGGGINSITKLNQSGTVIWSQVYPLLPDSTGWESLLAEKANGTFALAGSSYGGSDKLSLSVVDSTGHILLYKKISTANLNRNINLYNMGYKANTVSHEEGYILSGWIQNDPRGTGYLIKMDSTGQVFPSVISGSVFADYNNNCIQDGGDGFMTPVYLTLGSPADTFMVVTGDSGYYSLGLDPTNYSIQVIPPSPYWQPSVCDPASISLATGADSVVNLGLTPILYSPYITINGHLGRQVACRPVVYTAQYCNTGTAPFAGHIDITVDSLLHVDSASSPILSQSGNTYTFGADTIGVMQCATIQIYCTVPCGASYMSRTTCIDAQAFQDTIVNPSPLWDHSNLRMSASYDAASDSITFTLKNKGTGGMSGPKGMIVIEDNVILMTRPIQLAAGAQVLQQVKANGATWRASILQTDFNPYSKYATAAIEAAGTNGSGGVSLGYITQYPYNGYTSYETNTCAQIYNSYDPNDKSVSPTGAGTNHLVDTNVVLEYTIDFQNTGTNIAYTVKVTDTLASYLDPASLRLEISSHPCQIQMIDRNTVSFNFYNINLPDSSAGERLSTGFVKFRINQKAGNTNGTVINNKAGIYFDYNAPVITNTATVRIGQVLVTGIQNVYAEKTVQISAYPNPFLSNTTIKVDGESFSDLQLDIYDISGQLVKHQETKNSNSFTIDRSSLNTGDYIFKICSNGKPVGHGKIIAQ